MGRSPVKNGNEKVKLLEAVSIGVGGMVGGGIFAVLGLAADLAKGGTPVAFLFAGLIALLTANSYAHLSKTYPDRGGTVRFVNEGYGRGLFSGGVNNLLWFSYVIMLSLYASAFGSYGPNLLSISGDRTIDSHILSSAVIILAAAINFYSLKIVSAIESYAVIFKLLILLVFIAIGVVGLAGNPNLVQLAPENWSAPLSLFAAGMVIFVAYEGFELIANAAPDIENPQTNIPRSYYIAVIFVIALYLAIAVVTVGSLSFKSISGAEDYVLAEAAKPMLGKAGFTAITVAALVSTFSAINASIYGGSRVSYELAEDDELPHEFTRELWNKPVGLAVTAVATLVAVNTLNLESISSAGSVGFLAIFAVVNSVAFKRADAIGGSRAIAIAGSVLCVGALMMLLVHTFNSSVFNFAVAIGLIVVCFAVEALYKRLR
ncbi:MAG: APC family permease [Parvularculaceae bacterium]